MPEPGRWWWHLILHTVGRWLHGDPRGFRSRDHRIHSSGDYKNPPPRGEHEQLHRFHKHQNRKRVVLPDASWPAIGTVLLQKCEKTESAVLSICVGTTHAHLLVELADDYKAARDFEARLKQASSHAVRHVLPGRVWAAGGKPIRIRDRAHQQRVYRYILDHAADGDWVWDFRKG